MLTKNEITALSLSPTKKDFVQIWNELLEVAGKLSERWDPTSTNESDPGIVILKALTGIADKLNYNIDKNTLEAFMPTAAQEDSMRKLCDMLGYNIKYYRSAETEVTIKHHNSSPSEDEEKAISGGLLIPKFTAITNSDKDISYFTTNQTPYYISSTTPSVTLNCMEGQLVKCESAADNNVITISQISENNRFYLPEAQVAENGIFVYNVYSDKDLNLVDDGTPWEKVDNLNVQVRGSRVFKFGYDSYESRPYIEFPEDYSELINDGLFIYYARTNGANGNISVGTLTQLELPTGKGWDKVSAESFSVENTFAATSGANIETIGQAYNNFKKTVGTFETLVTCRDYMNKIYTMTKAGKPLVSNILVTDIRNDLNRAVTICSCDDAGIFYKETSLTVATEVSNNEVESSEMQSYTSTVNKPVFNATRSVNGSHWFLGSLDGIPLAKADFIVGGRSSAFNAEADGDVEANSDGFWHIYQPKGWRTFNCKTTLRADKIDTTVNTITKTVEVKPAIDHFDLVLYPFKSYNQIRNNVRDIQEVYDSSFKYSLASFNNVKNKLDEANVKTIAHNIVPPREHDIVSINNYLRLSAIIGTNSKITAEEGTLLIENIKIALANAFNMRELDFGEEIPFESIVEVIEKADSRIKIVSLNEPALYTTFSVFEGLDSVGNVILQEYAVASDWLSETAAASTGRFENKETNTHTFNTQEAKKIYNNLAVRNVLAGRVPLFQYNTTYGTDFSEGAYTVSSTVPEANIPAGLKDIVDAKPLSADNPFAIFVDGDKTYTGEYIPLSGYPKNEIAEGMLDEPEEPASGKNDTTYTDDITNITYICAREAGSEGPTYAKIVYTEKATPQEYVDSNVIKNYEDAKITSITTSCKIKADPVTNVISNVTLADCEFIKFRAPNFSTNKTYPAYVNYHLTLANPVEANASYAKAKSVFALLNEEEGTRETKWEAALTYLARHKKTFKFTQRVSAVDAEGKVIIAIDNSKLPVENKTPADILANSGCVKLRSCEPILEWSSEVSSGDVGEDKLPEKSSLTLNIDDIKTLYFTNSAYFVKTADGNTNSIPDLIDSCLSDLVANANNVLPKSNAWTISYEFEYVPFSGATLADWGDFIKDNSLSLFGFTPAVEGNTVLWRTYGEGYSEGKYILDSTAKLMPFTSGFLSALEAPLDNVYVAESLGSDTKIKTLANNEEYMLRSEDKLYIEYTPSTTTEDGTTQELDSVKEILGAGTIIRPNGFEQGLVDSDEFAKSNSPHKQVTFPGLTGSVNMFSFGANEQVEIRDFAKVTLNKDSFTDSSVISFYKNFNNCEELEVAHYSNGVRINNSYTLKDGEYIFYTDQNKTELAYFTTGTEVTLEGKLTLPKFDVIDLATIFDSGLDAIPWVSKNLTTNDCVTFQEFQYITLGSGDTLKQLVVLGSNEYLDENWQNCDEVEYCPAGAEQPSKLPKINVSDEAYSGNGWKACSVLELSVSPNSAQTLRNTDKVETSVTLHRPNSVLNKDVEVKVGKINDPPISFKTNLHCQSSISKISISDVYNNPNNLDSFELKVFAEKTPTLMHTIRGSLLPYHEQLVADSSTEWVTAGFDMKNYGEVWNQVALSKLAPADDNAKDDNTLRLSASVLPNTYGIFSIYLDYGATANNVINGTWIQLLPGASRDAITIFNASEDELRDRWFGDDSNNPDKLALKQGINCIRVNKTGDIYIKTNQISGALYFDDLRLVDATPIEYVEGGNKKSLTTLGLNLSQIGYLDVSSEASKNTFNVFDMRIRRKLRDDYANNALSALEDRELLETKNVDSCWKALTANEDKLQTLVSFLDSAKQEVEQLKTTDYGGIFAKYKAIYESLAKELALKDALDSNQNTDELEHKLITLLESFTDIDASREEILLRLEQLKEAAEANASNFTEDKLRKGDILDDFEAVADTTTYPYLAEDIKFASRRKINARYGEQLDIIATDIENVLDSEEALTNALNYLLATKHSALLEQINALVSTYNHSLTNVVDEAQQIAVGEDVEGTTRVNYAELEAILYSLKEHISDTRISLLITRIESYADSGQYSDLAETVDALKLLLETVGTNNSIVLAIDALIAKVQAKTDAETDDDIKSDLAKLAASISSYYTTQLNAILGKIASVLEALNDTFTSAETYLNSSQDEQVKAILSRLETISDTASACLSIVDSFGNNTGFNIKDDYSDLPFGESAVLSTWPAYMSQALISGVSQLYSDIRDVVRDPIGATFNDGNFYSADKQPRAILIKAANIDAFFELFESAKTLAVQSSQIVARKELIEQLSNQIAVPAAISAAKATMDSVADENRNAVIHDIVTKLSQSADNYSVSEKQQLISRLKEELNKAIDLDRQLEEISAKLLCPRILILEKELPAVTSDSFYGELKNFIKTKQATLLAEDMSTSSLEALVLELDSSCEIYKALLTAIKENNQEDAIAWVDLDDTLLADSFVENLSNIVSSTAVKDQIANIRECRLFTYIKDLKDEFVIAWADSDNNYMDSTGSYFKKYIETTAASGKIESAWYTHGQYNNANDQNLYNKGSWHDADGKWKTSADELVSIDLKRTNTGEWLDCRENSVGVNIVINESINEWVLVDGTKFVVSDEELNVILNTLLSDVSALANNRISSAAKEAYATVALEEDILKDIRSIDKYNDFYYNVPIEANVAIDFNESEDKLNTLMNPAVYYDINNVNNPFVISKLDINYLTKGLKIARSSKLS